MTMQNSQCKCSSETEVRKFDLFITTFKNIVFIHLAPIKKGNLLHRFKVVLSKFHFPLRNLMHFSHN